MHQIKFFYLDYVNWRAGFHLKINEKVYRIKELEVYIENFWTRICLYVMSLSNVSSMHAKCKCMSKSL